MLRHTHEATGLAPWYVTMHNTDGKKPTVFITNKERIGASGVIHRDCQWAFDEDRKIFRLTGIWLDWERMSHRYEFDYTAYKEYDEEYASKFMYPEWEMMTVGSLWWKKEIKVWKDGVYLLKDGRKTDFMMTVRDIIITIDKE